MKQLKISILSLIVFTILTGLIYPLAMTGIAQILFPHKANGSLATVNNKVVGSELIEQSFTKPEYFHGRPSAANFDATNSNATNFGPTNQKLISQIDSTARAVRAENNLPPDAPVPVDLVTSSASGLDPHISLDAALLQVPRVAKSRSLQDDVVTDLVQKYTEKPLLGLFGDPVVNVLKLNMALDVLKK